MCGKPQNKMVEPGKGRLQEDRKDLVRNQNRINIGKKEEI